MIARNLHVDAIIRHLKEKRTYTTEYIDRVEKYLELNPDLAEEFYTLLPKNTILDDYISVNGYDIRQLGRSTMLSRSAIYVVLCRIRGEDTPPEQIIEEELEILQRSKTYLYDA